MRTRWFAVVGVALFGVGLAQAQFAPASLPASAQPSLGPSLPTFPAPAPATPAAATQPTQTPVPLPPPASPSAPGQIPPLLPVPQPPGLPLPEVPRPGGPPIDYDNGYQYLPEQLPDRSRRHLGDEVCAPEGRWWVIPSLGLAWASTQPPPGLVRLRIPDPANPGSTLAGPRLPVAGLDAGRFEAAFGLVLGHWFDADNTHGLEASFFVRDANTTFDGHAPGMLVVFPGGTDRSAPQVLSLPPQNGQQVTTFFPATIGTYFVTADVNYRQKLLCADNYRLDALAGYRYAFLGDELYLGDLPDGSSQAFRLNRAAVSNSFNAGQVGLAGEVRANGWFVNGSAKMAFGVVSTEVTASGMFASAQTQTPNGFKRLNALGSPGQNEFAVMPTLGVQFGRQLGRHSRLFTGYSFNYLSRAGRLGDALNPANAGVTYTSFWTQSINFGGEIRF